jgi:hypothetical protein
MLYNIQTLRSSIFLVAINDSSSLSKSSSSSWPFFLVSSYDVTWICGDSMVVMATRHSLKLNHNHHNPDCPILIIVLHSKSRGQIALQSSKNINESSTMPHIYIHVLHIKSTIQYISNNFKFC